jgi:hypothetical protein
MLPTNVMPVRVPIIRTVLALEAWDDAVNTGSAPASRTNCELARESKVGETYSPLSDSWRAPEAEGYEELSIAVIVIVIVVVLELWLNRPGSLIGTKVVQAVNSESSRGIRNVLQERYEGRHLNSSLNPSS